MERVIIVRDLDEFEAFRAARRKDWREFQVYTPRPRACLELRMAGIPARTLGEHISAAEAERIYRRAFADATHIVEVVSEAQGAGIVQLARLFKVYYWEFLVDVYALDAVLSEWVREPEGFSLHYGWSSGPPPTTTHTKLVDPGPLAEHVFKVSMLHLRGQVQPIQARLPFWTDTRHVTRAWLRQVWRSALGRLRRIRRTDARPPALPELPVGKRAIGWGSSYDALIVIPDMIQVAEETGLRPLLVTEGIDSSTNRTGLVYKKSYDSIERFSIVQYLRGSPVPSLTSAEREQVQRAYTSLLTAIDRTVVGAKYQLSSLFQGLRPELNASLLLAKQLNHVLSQWAGSAVVLTNFNGVQERIIEQLAPHHNIHMYAKLHGWLANPEGYEFDAAHYVVPGRLQAQFVRQFFGYGEQVVVKADPNLTRVADEWRSKSEEERQILAVQNKRSLGITARYVIVVLTTMARNRILSEFEYSTLRDCWLSILDYLKNHPEFHVVVKAHPKFNYNPWLSALSEQQKVQNLSVLSGRLEEVLGWADLVVDLGFPGTATLVTLLFRKPLLLYRGLHKYVRDFGDLTHAVGRSFTVESSTALLEEWDRLTREGEGYLRALRARNRVLLESLTGNRS